VLDGPLAFDNAIDPQAAEIKGIKSPVAGRAQILVVPDLEAGNMLAKNLTFLAKAGAAGIVLGARVPIVLTSRMASCGVAVLYAHARRTNAPIARGLSVHGEHGIYHGIRRRGGTIFAGPCRQCDGRFKRTPWSTGTRCRQPSSGVLAASGVGGWSWLLLLPSELHNAR
jgi:hypothetical protein